MQLKELFCDTFQIALNDANGAEIDIINEVNATLIKGMENITVREYTDAVEAIYRKYLDPIAEQLEVTYHLELFAFPTIIHKKKERMAREFDNTDIC